MNEDTSQEVVEDTANTEVETEVEAPQATEDEPSSQQEEPQEELPRKYAGKYDSVEVLERAYSEAQSHISSTRKVEPQLPADKQQILNELQQLGVVTANDLKQHQAMMTQQGKDNSEISKLGINSSQEKALRRYSQHPDNIHKSMTDLWGELSGISGGKVVKRTVLKPKNSAKSSEFKVLSQRELVKLPKDEYDKYWARYRASKADS